MHIKHLVRDCVNGLGDVWAKGKVGDEVTIHDVDVDPISVGYGAHFFAQAGEVGGEDGWGNNRSGHAP